jgi:hypothetical protein
MKNTFKLIVMVPLVAMLWSACRQPVGPGQTQTRFFITPDTLRDSVYTEYDFSIHSNDTSWRAYKYLWDFSDGGQPVSVQSSNQVSHTYSQQGVYHITAIAMDTLDNVIAEAHSLAVIGVPQATVSLRPHSVLDSSESPILFTATTNPSLPVTYSWDFGDGSTPPYYNAWLDTASHGYSNDGVYRVIVTASYYGYTIGSDTAFVTVTLPHTTASTIFGMDSVIAIYSSNNHHFQFSLPLINRGDNSFTVNGSSFLAKFAHQFHLTIATGTLDTAERRDIGGALTSDGRYLIHALSDYADSFYTVSNNIKTYHGLFYSFPGDSLKSADSLKIFYAKPDSIAFVSTAHYWPSGYSYTDTTYQPSTGTGGGGCDGNPTPILIGFTGMYENGTITIIFRKRPR